MNRLQTLPPASTEFALRVDPDRLVDDHGDCLYRYALIRVRKQEVAEDLVQETLLAAMRQADKFSGRSSERSWLCGILKNKICDYFKSLAERQTSPTLSFSATNTRIDSMASTTGFTNAAPRIGSQRGKKP